MCDHVAIINHGRIAAIDTPERLKRTVKNLQSVEVAFESVSSDMLKELREFPNVSDAVKKGDKFRLITDDPTSVLTSTWNYAQKNNLRLVTVNTLGPSLEDVFVKLTGIRSAAEGEGNSRVKTQERSRRLAEK
jgi:ABC-2 type transport system ATP-binding protein